MTMKISDPETKELAKLVSDLTGETEIQVVKVSLCDRLNQIKRQKFSDTRIQEIKEIAKHCRSLPVLDNRNDEEILGYDDKGLPN